MNEAKTMQALDKLERSILGKFPDLLPGEMLQYWKAKRVDWNGRGETAFSHLLWMIEQCRTMATQGKLLKAMRWLGFIQGVLWMSGEWSIEDLKEVNKPGPIQQEAPSADQVEPTDDPFVLAEDFAEEAETEGAVPMTVELEDAHGTLVETKRCEHVKDAAATVAAFISAQAVIRQPGSVRFEPIKEHTA